MFEIGKRKTAPHVHFSHSQFPPFVSFWRWSTNVDDEKRQFLIFFPCFWLSTFRLTTVFAQFSTYFDAISMSMYSSNGVFGQRMTGEERTREIDTMNCLEMLTMDRVEVKKHRKINVHSSGLKQTFAAPLFHAFHFGFFYSFSFSFAFSYSSIYSFHFGPMFGRFLGHFANFAPKSLSNEKKSFIRSQWLLSSRQKTSSPTNKWELKPDKWQWIVSIRRMNEWMAKHDVRCWFSLHLLSFLHFFFVFFLVSHRCLVCLKMIQNCGENITICCDAEHYKAIQMYQCWNHAISCWLFLSCRSSCEAEEKVSI